MHLFKKRFKFYVIVKCHKTRLFNSLPDILDAVSTFNNPLWVGFDSLHNAYLQENNFGLISILDLPTKINPLSLTLLDTLRYCVRIVLQNLINFVKSLKSMRN